MKIRRVSRKQDGLTMVPECMVADSAFDRMRGLLGRTGLAASEGLWIQPCNSIHTFFMKFPIDVLYLDRENKVVAIFPGVKPWRAHLPVFAARSVLELPVGAASKFQIGDVLCLN